MSFIFYVPGVHLGLEPAQTLRFGGALGFLILAPLLFVVSRDLPLGIRIAGLLLLAALMSDFDGRLSWHVSFMDNNPMPYNTLSQGAMLVVAMACISWILERRSGRSVDLAAGATFLFASLIKASSGVVALVMLFVFRCCAPGAVRGILNILMIPMLVAVPLFWSEYISYYLLDVFEASIASGISRRYFLNTSFRNAINLISLGFLFIGLVMVCRRIWICIAIGLLGVFLILSNLMNHTTTVLPLLLLGIVVMYASGAVWAARFGVAAAAIMMAWVHLSGFVYGGLPFRTDLLREASQTQDLRAIAANVEGPLALVGYRPLQRLFGWKSSPHLHLWTDPRMNWIPRQDPDPGLRLRGACNVLLNERRPGHTPHLALVPNHYRPWLEAHAILLLETTRYSFWRLKNASTCEIPTAE
jgi:hypothetical protein